MTGGWRGGRGGSFAETEGSLCCASALWNEGAELDLFPDGFEGEVEVYRFELEEMMGEILYIFLVRKVWMGTVAG